MKAFIHKHFLGLSVLAVLAGIGMASESVHAQRLWKSRPSSSKPPVIRVYDFSPLVRKIKPTVFNLFVEGTRTTGRRSYGWPFSKRRRFRSRGSGFFISPKGYALTNYHVVKNATKIQAQMFDKRIYKVRVLGKSPELDVALIRVIHPRGKSFRFAYLGDSSRARVGAPVVAIGNARGLGLTVTAGIISAKGRELGGQYQAFIQTDAAINRGNSGGPLFNKRGDVVGINTAILRGGRGIGFAVPINIVKRIIPQLRKRGYVQRAQLGVTIQAVSTRLARKLRLSRPMGALVSEVAPQSPAALGGIRSGDVIVGFNGKSISNFTDLPRLVAFSPAGARVKLTVIRRGRRIKRTVRLVKWGQKLARRERADGNNFDGENFLQGRRRSRKRRTLRRRKIARPKRRVRRQRRPRANTGSMTRALRRLGIGVSSVGASLRQRMKLKPNTGVLVTSVRRRTPASRNGLRRGDVIIEINRTPVRSVGQFMQQLAKVPGGENVLMLVRRADSALFLAFALP